MAYIIIVVGIVVVMMIFGYAAWDITRDNDHHPWH